MIDKDVWHRIERIKPIFGELCRYVRENTLSHVNNGLKKDIENYIFGNYMDTELCLKKIAEHFGYENTYFSKLFKELFQENFAVNLERIRIERVCELLRTGETLECIVSQCGYNSVAVMRTAFKRTKGLTPKEYRELYHVKEK